MLSGSGVGIYLARSLARSPAEGTFFLCFEWQLAGRVLDGRRRRGSAIFTNEWISLAIHHRVQLAMTREGEGQDVNASGPSLGKGEKGGGEKVHQVKQ